MIQNDTIVALSTANAVSAIAVIRISGNETADIIKKIFKKNKRTDNSALFDFKPRYAYYGNIGINDEITDDAVMTLYKKPGSYTGEDMAEISCHGNMIIVKKIIRMIIDNGARTAEPGEFTKRAFINGRIDLTQSEAVMDVISAGGEQALASARRQLEGHLGAKIRSYYQELTDILSEIGYHSDFDEGSEYDIDIKAMTIKIEGIAFAVQKLIDTYDDGIILKNGLRCCITGKPNVGKSTIMNALAKSERSIVTEAAGTTRDVVEDTIKIGETVINMADTAGIRENSTDKAEKIGIERSINRLNESDIIIAVFDGSDEFDKMDKNIVELIKSAKTEKKKTVIAVLNKSDLKSRINLPHNSNVFDEIVSANKTDVGELKAAIEKHAESVCCDGDIITNERHLQCLTEAYDELANVKEALCSSLPIDMAYTDIRAAAVSFASITGDDVNESIVDKIFANFCTGK